MEEVETAVMGDSWGDWSGDSLATGEGDVGSTADDICSLLSFSSVEKETVFLRFLSGGTRTTGEEGRRCSADGGCFEGSVVVCALISFASPKGNKVTNKFGANNNRPTITL